MEYHITTEESKLIEISQKNPLTEVEKKTILAMISTVNSADAEDKIYELSIQELYYILEIEGSDSSLQFNKIIDELLSKVVKIEFESGDWVMTHWIGSVKYIEDYEMIQFRLSPDLKPHFLQLKRSLSL